MFPNLVEASSQRWIVMFIIADEMKFTNPARLPVYQIPIRRRKPRLAFFGQPVAALVNTSYTRVVTAKPCYEKSQLTALRSGKIFLRSCLPLHFLSRSWIPERLTAEHLKHGLACWRVVSRPC
jgi:hypothetical protein